MAWFKKDAKESQIQIVRDVADELGLVNLNNLNEKVEDAVKKSFSFSQFDMSGIEDGGGFFGQEFDLRATSGRMKAAYVSEPWVYIAADKIARTLASVDFKIRNASTGEDVDVPELENILSGGNPDQDGYTLNWSGYLDLMLGGNFFKASDEAYTTPVHVPVDTVNLRMRENLTKEQALTMSRIESLEVFERGVYASTTATAIPYEQTIHFKLPNPYSSVFGLSPFTSASRPILLDRNKNEFELAFYLRGATNAGVIETTEEITKKRMSRLMSTFEQTFTGKRNWWRTLFLPKGAKWVNSGLTMKEMEHLEGLRENRRTILTVLGIPLSQVGIVEDVNRATAETQERYFWKETIEPLTKFVAAGYNDSFLFKQKYKGVYEVYADLDSVEALQDSDQGKAEKAKAVEDIATVDEQREMIGLDPLPDGRGMLLKTELLSMGTELEEETEENEEELEGTSITIEAGSTDHKHEGYVNEAGNGQTEEDETGHTHALKGSQQANGTIIVTVQEVDGHTHPDVTLPGSSEEVQKNFKDMKGVVVDSQERLERVAIGRYSKALKGSIDMLLDQTSRALSLDVPVGMYLNQRKIERTKAYGATGIPILSDTMVRGFDFANSTKKSIASAIAKAYKFTPADEQAIESLKQRNEKKERARLAEKGVNSFAGFDETQTENVEKLIEQGLRDGKTNDQIASTIKEKYGEAYSGQSETIARTEVLGAISHGIAWNQDELKKVFSEVRKQWLHVGDVGTNPNARSIHLSFEDLGEVKSDFVYEDTDAMARLSYPRDPRGNAASNINCRCSLVNVVPDGATSNAQTILENS